jgi:integrase
MPRYVRPLSLRGAQALKKPGVHAAGDGLYLQVRPTGTRDWVFRYRLAGRDRWMGLGALATLTLAEARARAKKARLLVLDGIDPIEQRAATRGQPAVKPLTFRECAERYVAARAARWKDPANAARAWLAILTNNAKVLLDEPVAAIDTDLVMRAVEPIWQTKTKTAELTRNKIAMTLDYAKSRGLRSGDNPARWVGHIETMLPHPDDVVAVKPMEAMPFVDVPAFVAELRADDHPDARCLEFHILTGGGARSKQTTAACWDQLDDIEHPQLWTVPAELMKGKKTKTTELRVPLSDAAIAVLEGQKGLDPVYIFPGRSAGKPVDQDAVMRPLRKRGLVYTAHGFRSSFRDWVGEETTFPSELAEASIAHAVGTTVERRYRRGDFFKRRRQVMEAWARYVGQPAPASAKVVAIGVR